MKPYSLSFVISLCLGLLAGTIFPEKHHYFRKSTSWVIDNGFNMSYFLIVTSLTLLLSIGWIEIFSKMNKPAINFSKLSNLFIHLKPIILPWIILMLITVLITYHNDHTFYMLWSYEPIGVTIGYISIRLIVISTLPFLASVFIKKNEIEERQILFIIIYILCGALVWVMTKDIY